MDINSIAVLLTAGTGFISAIAGLIKVVTGIRKSRSKSHKKRKRHSKRVVSLKRSYLDWEKRKNPTQSKSIEPLKNNAATRISRETTGDGF